VKAFCFFMLFSMASSAEQVSKDREETHGPEAPPPSVRLEGEGVVHPKTILIGKYSTIFSVLEHETLDEIADTHRVSLIREGKRSIHNVRRKWKDLTSLEDGDLVSVPLAQE